MTGSESIPCDLCGSTNLSLAYRQPDPLFVRDEWFNVVRCDDCGLGFVNPRPDRTEIAKHYPAEFYQEFDEYGDRHTVRYQHEADLVEQAHGTWRPPGRLLDIGCANGDFPRLMRRRGWEVEGLEISSNARAISDFHVYRSEFPAAEIPAGSFDVATAWAVLEHVHHPGEHFKKAAEILKPGGLFIFLVTNFRSTTSSKLFGEDVPRHLYFFTEPTVRRYLWESGFEFVRADYSDRIHAMMPLNWLRYQLLHRAMRRPFQWADSRHTPHAYFTDRRERPNLRSAIRYVATHPFSTIDRLVAPLIGRIEMALGDYGVVTYVAKRKQ